MPSPSVPLPLLLDAHTLALRLDDPGLLIIDLGKPGTYAQAHVPGAISVDYRHLQLGSPPTPGALPDAGPYAELLTAIGLAPDTHVVAYDDEGGGRAARLLWTLDAAGHRRYSLLDGGIHAWLDEEHPYQTEDNPPLPGSHRFTGFSHDSWVELDELRSRLEDPQLVIWDARSEEEYLGLRALASRAGHIPGAVHYEWSRAFDPNRAMRLRPLDSLRTELAALGITPDKEVITHCQSHHRAAFTWLLGRILGFERIRGYPGGWSEWGNRQDTPVTTRPPA